MLPNKINDGVIKALCYSDIFDYPLTPYEIMKFYIGDEKVDLKNINLALDNLLASQIIEAESGYFTLYGRKSIVGLRQSRSKISAQKTIYAIKVAFFLARIPTVKFIGLSGSLSVDNSKEEDDIDFFIVTKKNTLWLSRFLVTLALFITGKKRSKGKSETKNKICANMFLTEDNLRIKKNKRNLYSAHEIIQVKPIMDKEEVYEKFLNENYWITEHLPNIEIKPFLSKKQKTYPFLNFINDLFFIGQYIYMMKRITNEDIQYNAALFHPVDLSPYVLDLYNIRAEMCLKRPINDKNIVRRNTEDTPGY